MNKLAEFCILHSNKVDWFLHKCGLFNFLQQLKYAKFPDLHLLYYVKNTRKVNKLNSLIVCFKNFWIDSKHCSGRILTIVGGERMKIIRWYNCQVFKNALSHHNKQDRVIKWYLVALLNKYLAMTPKIQQYDRKFYCYVGQ